MRVAALQCSERHVEVEIFVLVGVPEMNPLRSVDEERVRLEEPVVGVNAQRRPAPSVLPELLGTGRASLVLGERSLEPGVQNPISREGPGARSRTVRVRSGSGY
jgi:hypothetical protein